MGSCLRHLLSLVLVTWCVAVSAATQIHDIRISNYDKDTTRVVLDLSGNPGCHYFLLADPNRFVIDFQDAKNSKALQKIALNNAAVKKVRSGRPDPKTLRLVLELNQAVQVKQFQLPGEAKQQRLVFDLRKKNIKSKVKTAPITPMINRGRDIIVVIDAGHGGKDPGAHGKGGTLEKTVVLAIAHELSRLINQQTGMTAVMTRDGNYYVPLRKRLQKAHQKKGDVFISIHADAFKNPKSSGASVYALSLKGASSEAARWLAEKENYSELGQVNLSDKDDVLRSVLIDLSQTATISAGLDLGSLVLSNMKAITKLHHAKVEQARFVVLKSPDIPSILVETGFISNPQEERRLRNPKYQKQMAQAIMKGITSYFRYRSPPGTWLAQHYGQHQEFKV